MKHFRSLLALGAIDDSDFLDADEINKIYNKQQQKAKSTRLSQRKKNTSKFLQHRYNNSKDNQPTVDASTVDGTGEEDDPIPRVFTFMDGKIRKFIKLDPYSYSTKLPRRQFVYPLKHNKKKQSNGDNTNVHHLKALSLSILQNSAEVFPVVLQPFGLERDLSTSSIHLELPMEAFRDNHNNSNQLLNNPFISPSPSPSRTRHTHTPSSMICAISVDPLQSTASISSINSKHLRNSYMNPQIPRKMSSDTNLTNFTPVSTSTILTAITPLCDYEKHSRYDYVPIITPRLAVITSSSWTRPKLEPLTAHLPAPVIKQLKHSPNCQIIHAQLPRPYNAHGQAQSDIDQINDIDSNYSDDNNAYIDRKAKLHSELPPPKRMHMSGDNNVLYDPEHWPSYRVLPIRPNIEYSNLTLSYNHYHSNQLIPPNLNLRASNSLLSLDSTQSNSMPPSPFYTNLSLKSSRSGALGTPQIRTPNARKSAMAPHIGQLSPILSQCGDYDNNITSFSACVSACHNDLIADTNGDYKDDFANENGFNNKNIFAIEMEKENDSKKKKLENHQALNIIKEQTAAMTDDECDDNVELKVPPPLPPAMSVDHDIYNEHNVSTLNANDVLNNRNETFYLNQEYLEHAVEQSPTPDDIRFTMQVTPKEEIHMHFPADNNSMDLTDVFAPKLATIRSEQSYMSGSTFNNNNNMNNMKFSPHTGLNQNQNHNHLLSFGDGNANAFSSGRTSRTVTTNESLLSPRISSTSLSTVPADYILNHSADNSVQSETDMIQWNAMQGSAYNYGMKQVHNVLFESNGDVDKELNDPQCQMTDMYDEYNMYDRPHLELQSRDSEVILPDFPDDDNDNTAFLNIGAVINPLMLSNNSNEITLTIDTANMNSNDSRGQMTFALKCDSNHKDKEGLKEDPFHTEEIEALIDKAFPVRNFQVMKQIGRGAYGVVDKAFDLRSCQIVAIKKSRSAQKHMVSSFYKEVCICKELSECPYVIDMVICGTDKKKNEVCIGLNYMNMSSLKSVCKYSLLQVKHICFCVLTALDAMHELLYVHNDIKPDNILINSNGDVKLTDFGCAKKMVDANTPLTEAVGSVKYQSYEKKFESPIRYTTKSDIYSFGITICEILAATHTVNDEDDDGFVYKIPSKILQEYSANNEDLIDFLNICLNENSKERGSAKELLSHAFLDNYQNNASNEKRVITFTNEYIETQKFDDLQFMTDTLIDYYLHYSKSQRTSAIITQKNAINNFKEINRSNFFNGSTPIDVDFSDAQRIDFIADNCGYPVAFVREFIIQSVKQVRNRYLTK